MKLDIKDIESLTGFNDTEIRLYCSSRLSNNLSYHIVKGRERQCLIDKIKRDNDANTFPLRSREAFNNSYMNYYVNFLKTRNIEILMQNEPKLSIIPFRRPKIYLRFRGEYIVPESRNFENHLRGIIRACLYHKYISTFENIYEVGCGYGVNLIHFAQMSHNQHRLIGIDFASACTDILNLLRVSYPINAHGMTRDITESLDIILLPNSAVVTFAALEQVGELFDKFIDFILDQRPAICINREPIYEVYPDTEMGELARRHSDAQGYLRGYWPRLLQLESEGAIEIIAAQRVDFGGLYHDAYNYIVWKPY